MAKATAMNKNEVTYTTVLFTKQPKQDNTFPLKLRITYQRKQQYYGIGKSATKETWEKLKESNLKGELRKLKLAISEVEEGAKDIIDKIINKDGEFSFHRFKEIISGNDSKSNWLFQAYSSLITELENNSKVGSKIATENAYNSFRMFFNDKDIKLNDITPAVLKRYERWMVEDRGNSTTTVGIYLRSLRSVFNKLIAVGVVDINCYPFGMYKYQLPAAGTRDKVIDSDILRKIHGYQPEEFSNIDKGKDLWFFLYQCNGMNVKDMCRLRFSDFKEDHFVFTRAKTEGKTKDSVDIRVVLNDDILRIIEKWGNKNEGSNYVFPFYTGAKVSPAEERRVTQNLVSFINDNMNRIAKKLELDINITTYSARQTFSNVLMNSNAPIKLIAETLGHTSTLTTEKHYLKKMQLEKQKEFTKDLLNFNIK